MVEVVPNQIVSNPQVKPGESNTPDYSDCLSVNQTRCDKLGHVVTSQGEGHGCDRERDVVKSIDASTKVESDCFTYDLEVANQIESGTCSNQFGDDLIDENVGLPEISACGIRQSNIRVYKNQNGYGETEIIIDDVRCWEDLPKYVGVTSSVSICENFANLYDCGVPIYCIEVIPGSFIPVFHHCLAGVCRCVYILQGAVSQLSPCQFVRYLAQFDVISRRDCYVLTGVCRGFPIVDKGCNTSYYCENYSSVTKGDFKVEMTDKVISELEGGKVRRVSKKPTCVHSLGGVIKSDGSLRPITDCSSPEDININLYMDTSCMKFKYNSVDDVVDLLEGSEFCAVTDISSAYRSINVLPAHRDFQGFKWGHSSGGCVVQ